MDYGKEGYLLVHHTGEGDQWWAPSWCPGCPPAPPCHPAARWYPGRVRSLPPPDVKGWTDEEVFLTANLIFNTFNTGGSKGSVSVVMEPSYHLGPRPEIEIHIRNFLYSAFWPLNRRGCGWRLLIHVSPMRDISTMRVLLLISSLDRSTICSLVSSGLTIWMPFLLLM